MKYFSICSISIGRGCFVQVSKFGKYYSHLPIEQRVPFLVRGKHTPIHKRFLKNITNNTRLLSLFVLGYYFTVIFRYLRLIAYREFTRLVHGYLGKRRIPLPAFAHTAIRKALPSKEDEPLTGFQLDED